MTRPALVTILASSKIHELSHIRLNDFRLVGTYVERDVQYLHS